MSIYGVKGKAKSGKLKLLKLVMEWKRETNCLVLETFNKTFFHAM